MLLSKSSIFVALCVPNVSSILTQRNQLCNIDLRTIFIELWFALAIQPNANNSFLPIHFMFLSKSTIFVALCVSNVLCNYRLTYFHRIVV